MNEAKPNFNGNDATPDYLKNGLACGDVTYEIYKKGKPLLNPTQGESEDWEKEFNEKFYEYYYGAEGQGFKKLSKLTKTFIKIEREKARAEGYTKREQCKSGVVCSECGEVISMGEPTRHPILDK
jgi:hypothetical protein